jgi:Na+-transporting NADH:ubiquinone oxidoreductase subunit C
VPARDSIANTLIVAVSLSLVASVLVAGTAIALKPVQERNEARYRQQIILDVAGLWSPGADTRSLFESIDARMVDLGTGEYTDAVEVAGFDAIVAAKDPDAGIDIPASEDVANIHRRARYMPVYLVPGDDGNADQVILPIYGAGLWSTMYGFLAVGDDGNTILGLRFYEHAETPGLGDQVDKPEWRSQWAGKQIYDADGTSLVAVIRGRVDPGSPDAPYQVDGISGATLTGRGVTNLVRYWTGPDGFGPYLHRLGNEAADND